MTRGRLRTALIGLPGCVWAASAAVDVLKLAAVQALFCAISTVWAPP